MSEKKQRRFQLGSVKKGQYGSYISLDQSVKEIIIKREYKNKDGEVKKETLVVGLNEKGYMPAINLKKVEQEMAEKVKLGFITDDEAERRIEKAKEYGISSYVTLPISE